MFKNNKLPHPFNPIFTPSNPNPLYFGTYWGRHLRPLGLVGGHHALSGRLRHGTAGRRQLGQIHGELLLGGILLSGGQNAIVI